MNETERLLIEKGDMAAWAAIASWYGENGIDDLWEFTPQDRFAARALAMSPVMTSVPDAPQAGASKISQVSATGDELAKATALAAGAQSLDELRQVIADFEGLAIRKTAMNMVFSSGFSGARVMVVGDPPETDEDRSGIPFSGPAGELLDKMFAAIGLSRAAVEKEKSLYLTHMLNWRPPGNRSPTPLEIDCSTVFLKRHIALAAPEMVVVAGALAVKALFSNTTTPAKLRGKTHMIDLGGGISSPSMVLYAPSFLMRAPLKKKEAWDDLLMLRAYLDKQA
ncbi:MAG: uracil-DNA glycosylase [Pseudobdellovibrionaceae bacterium]